MSFDNNNNDKTSSRNFIIAMILFMGIMFGYDYFTAANRAPTAPQSTTETSDDHDQPKSMDLDKDERDDSQIDHVITTEEALSKDSRLSLENSHISGSIDLNGGILDSIVLKNYKESVEENSKNVMLLTPKHTETPFYYAISYLDKTNDVEIAEDTVWTSSDQRDKKSQDIFLKTQTQNGLVIERHITLDDGYMVNIRDRILNVSSNHIKVHARSELTCHKPRENNYAVVHEGLVGCADGKVSEIKYKKIKSKKNIGRCQWFGYTDIYWLCALINHDKNSIVSYEKFDDDTYKISTSKKRVVDLSPNSMIELNYSLFAGPKDIGVLKNYRDSNHIEKFDMAIDFGWFFIITKPLIQLVDIFAEWFSNMGMVILILTLLLRLLTYPLMKKSFISAAKMKEIQPKITKLQKLYANDKVRMNQEMMALYKREQVSPMSGCLPMLLQAPIFFCLYKVFFISIQMRHAPLFGWIHDLSAADPLYFANLFGVFDWTPPSFLQIGIWPLIMGLTMFLQQKLTSGGKQKSSEKSNEQKMQENMMLVLPVLFTYICASFPVAVVIYWTISNILSMVQQYYVNKKILGRKSA